MKGDSPRYMGNKNYLRYMTDKELKTIIEDIQASPRECEWVEIKKDNSKPELIGEYVSALANGAAYMGQPKGYLVFGIDDSSHAIVGTKFSPKDEKVGNQEIENWIASLLNPRIDFCIQEIEVSGKRVVLFIIDSVKDTPVKFKGTAYIRVGSYKKPLSEHPERERKIWQNSRNSCFELSVAKSGLKDDEVLQLIDYPNAFRLLQEPLSENKHAILQKLEEEKVVCKRPSCFDITNLGAILFAHDLRTFDSLARKAVRVIFYRGNNRLHAMKELVEWKGYAIGFQSVVDYLSESLPVNEEIGRSQRKETPVYPPIAIREFVANALIHQDFSISGTSPMIEVFQSRLEITNPGKPLIDILRFIDHAPISRNEKLAFIMRRMNFCEERGSGVDRAISECELYQLPAPDFTNEEAYTRVSMFTPKAMRGMNKEDKIRACYQHCCLQYVSGKKMTNESLRVRLNITPSNYSTASRIISDTVGAGLIKLDDATRSRKYAQYVPVWV